MPILFLLSFVLLCVAVPASAQWQAQESQTNVSLRGVCAVSEAIAWASGTNGTVLRTTDGGKHWEKLPVPDAETLDFRDIQAFDADTAFVLSSGPGDKSQLFKTTDGGKHWIRQFTNTEPKAFYDGFAFWDRKHAIAMSDPVDGHFLLRTTEDGERWNLLPPESLPPALPDEGGFAASGTCIAVQGKNDVWFVTGGAVARLFHSSDRGKTWTVRGIPIIAGIASQGAFSIAFSDSLHGVIVGGDYAKPDGDTQNVAYTDDAGKTWHVAEQRPKGYRSAVAFVPGTKPQLWVTVGTTGSDYSRDGGKTWQPLDTQNYNAVSLVSAQVGWAVGPKGYIARLNGTP